MTITTLLSDFGTYDHYVAAMKGEILRRCREVTLVDISHEVGAHNIKQASYILENSWKSFPEGTVHLAVVDPGVGGQRLPIIARLDDHLFVCPDNGILSDVVTTAKEAEFRIIEDVGLFNTPVSATFHGRDIFAPVAGWLASGGNFEDVGQVADSITLLPEMLFSVEAEFISAEIIHIDHFGNLITSIKKDDFVVRMLMERNFSLFINDYCVKEFYPNYSVAGETPFLLWGSGGHLEISVRNSNAAAYLGVVCGQNLTLKTAN